MVIVDTNAWIELFRRSGDPSVKLAMGHLVKAGEAYMSGPVLMELISGARPDDLPRLKNSLRAYPMAQDPQRLWIDAGSNYSHLRAHGITVPREDVLIATVALFHRCRVYSSDSHFPAIAPILGLRLYTPGPGGTFVPDNS
ncbi:PIN domain-containing protein [Haloferula sargassicola]|uniref:PIN domain-containing protein n=1 Tax=Haloferula sargassicola TaxID=490096 RepID=UPI0033655C0B